MALERVGVILGRVAGTRPPQARPMRDTKGYALDCCDECPIWAPTIRMIVQHRVMCATFQRTVLEPLTGGLPRNAGRRLTDG